MNILAAGHVEKILAFNFSNAKIILLIKDEENVIIPDRLVAGRKILALLTVVRIHLREF